MGSLHRLYVFTKLHSFQLAADKIRLQLEQITHGISVEHYQSGDYADISTGTDGGTVVTAVIVIDARQTRALITPSQRDHNVDHWDELSMLMAKVTRPKGSFLIVIYGDEESRNLAELVSKDWLTTWEYSDENTLCLAAKGRVFTVWETFNDSQKTAILNYLDRVPFVSSLDGVRNVLVLGCTGDSDVTRYIEDNPLLKKCELDADHVCADINMFTSFDYDMKPGVRANEATITLFQVCPEYPIQVCERLDIERTIADDLLRLIEKTTNPRFRHVFDSVIINCHCSDCFNTIIDSLGDITIKIRKQLGETGSTLQGTIFPVVLGQHAGSIREHLARNINENQPWGILPSENSRNFSHLTDVDVLKLYIWNAIQSTKSPLRSPTDGFARKVVHS
uniref:Uncharacterized protein LOC100379020 n=1 Tax=Saccoglossus kowalevskii TaxID=10224 RepID=A0ABM0GRZ0_SACKO|nr:PREDICTED: uncharacterized protein LOC100379020 [Saccoglossus kowalevskii]